jgi:hypothetical protein
VRAGRAVAAEAGAVGTRVLLEPGGSDPFIVLADADLTKAVQMGVASRLASGSVAKPGVIAARYAAAGRDYAPSGAPFASPDELGAVLSMPQLGLRLIRRHQLHGGICHCIGCCSTASAEWTYRLVMEWVLCPSKDAIVGSLCPISAARLHRPIADDRRLAGSTGSPILGWDWSPIHFAYGRSCA